MDQEPGNMCRSNGGMNEMTGLIALNQGKAVRNRRVRGDGDKKVKRRN